MPYHIKSVGALGTGDIYYKADDTWTQIYADRKQYSNKSDADAQIANPIKFVNGFQVRANGGFANATVVTE